MVEEDFSRYNGEGTDLRKVQDRLLEMLVEFDRICKKYDISYFLSGGTCLGAVRHGGFIPWDDDVDIDVWHTDYKKLEKILPGELPERFFMQTMKSDLTFYRLYMKIVDRHSKVVYEQGQSIRANLQYDGVSIDILPIRRVYSYRIKYIIDRLYKSAAVTVRTHNHGAAWNFAASYILYPVMHAVALAARWFTFLSPKEKVSHDYGTGMTPKLKYSNLFPSKPISFEGYALSGPAQPDAYLSGLYGDYMTIPPRHKREVHGEEFEVYEPRIR